MIAETSIAIGGTAITVAALATAIIKSSGQSAFLYANARTVARNSYIFDRKNLSSFLHLKALPEFINQLKDTEYYPYLETIDKNNITEFNIEIEKGFISSIKEVQKISPKKFKKVFDVYTKIFESKIIKTFFRSRFSNIEIDKKLLEPIGTINPVLLQHLYETKTIADMKLVLRDTTYKDVFKKEYETIEEFDSTIEKNVMKDIDSALEEIKVYDKKAIMDIFEKRREIKHILMLLKLSIRGIDKETQEKLIDLPKLGTKRLIDAEDIKTLVKSFSTTEYAEPMKNALEEFNKYDNYYAFEKELLRHYLNFVTDNDLLHTIGPYPIISYITKKEIEQKNLLIIAKGIITEKNKEEIGAMLI